MRHVRNEPLAVIEQLEEAFGASAAEVLGAVASELVWIQPRKVHQGVDGLPRHCRPQIEQLRAERCGHHGEAMAQQVALLLVVQACILHRSVHNHLNLLYGFLPLLPVDTYLTPKT